MRRIMRRVIMRDSERERIIKGTCRFYAGLDVRPPPSKGGFFYSRTPRAVIAQ